MKPSTPLIWQCYIHLRPLTQMLNQHNHFKSHLCIISNLVCVWRYLRGIGQICIKFSKFSKLPKVVKIVFEGICEVSDCPKPGLKQSTQVGSWVTIWDFVNFARVGKTINKYWKLERRSTNIDIDSFSRDEKVSHWFAPINAGLYKTTVISSICMAIMMVT